MKIKKMVSWLICCVMSFTVFGMVMFNHANSVDGLELTHTKFNLSSDDFTADSVLLDPESTSGTGNFGGNIRVEPIVTQGTDAIAFRIKNLTNDVYKINTFYIQNENNFSYSLMSSKVTFIDVNGNISEYKAVSGGRGVNVPASFDGVMVLPWNEVVCVKSGGGYYWDKKLESEKLNKDSTDPVYAYPTERISYLSIFFNREAVNAGENEILFGSIYTIKEVDDDVEVFKHENPIRLEGSPSTVITNGNLVKVTQYPNTTATYTLKVNGVEASFDETIDLHATSVQAKYGFSPKVNYTLSYGYSLSYIELDGSVVTLDEIINMSKIDSTHELNFVTVKEYNYKIGSEDTLSITDKKGVIVDVNNTLDEIIKYSLVVNGTDNSEFVASSKGAGIYIKEDGTAFYGNVFEIPAGFKGKVFIPFNTPTAGYGTVNNLPWSNILPETVKSTIRLSFIKTATITADTLETVFDNWDFVTAAPTVSLAANANLSTGDIDFDNGIAISVDKTFVNYWTDTPAVKISPSVDVNFNSLGLALRVRNIGTNDFSTRIYLVASNGATYVPSTEMKYQLVHSDGTVEQKIGNRTIVIPAGFDGTIIMNSHQYATDNLNIVGQNSNVLKEGLKLKTISIFINANQNDKLLISNKIAILDLNNNKVEIDSSFGMSNIVTTSATRDSVKYTATAELVNISNLDVKVNEEDYDGTQVTISHDKLLLGNELVVTPLEGYQIVGATLGDKELTANQDGSYSIIVTESYPEGVTLNVEVVAKYRVNVEFDDKLGTVKINDEDIDENVYYDKDVQITLNVTANNGYKIKSVTVNGTVVEAVNDAYIITITATTNINVEFEVITYTITYELDGGVNSPYNPTSYTINDSFVLGAPTKEGYEFKGWYVLNGTEKVDILRVDKGATGDLTIYASFEEIQEEPVDPVEPENPTPWLLIGGVGAGVAVLALGVFLIIKKRK